jgi:hypothetical protein
MPSQYVSGLPVINVILPPGISRFKEKAKTTNPS